MLNYIKQGLQIAFLDHDAIRKTAKDSKATLPAFIILIFTILVQIFIQLQQDVFDISDFWYVFIVMFLAGELIMFLVIHYTAKVFRGHAEFIRFFRPVALASLFFIAELLTLLNLPSLLISIIQGLIMIWGFIILYVIIHSTYSLNTLKTILTILIAYAVTILLNIAFTWIGINTGILTSLI